MREIDLEEFRGTLDDTYTTVLATDSRTLAKLTLHVEISEQCGSQRTYYKVRAAGVNEESGDLAPMMRKYWDIVYGE